MFAGLGLAEGLENAGSAESLEDAGPAEGFEHPSRFHSAAETFNRAASDQLSLASF